VGFAGFETMQYWRLSLRWEKKAEASKSWGVPIERHFDLVLGSRLP
jgi:hypothetical protein